MKHFYQNISGWFWAEDVYSAAVRNAPNEAHFVEVGSWKGRSTAFMAVEIANSGKKIKFDCVDNWQGSKNEEDHQYDEDTQHHRLFDVFQRNIAQVASYINPLRMDSAEAATLYQDGSLDFIYIDAAHDYESVKKDIAAWLPKLKPHGTISGDDYSVTWPGVMRAVKESFKLEEITVWGPTWVVDRSPSPRVPTCDIILRTHSGDNIHGSERVENISKTELIVRCLSSLIISIQEALKNSQTNIRLTIVDDHSSEECLEKIQHSLEKVSFEYSIKKLEEGNLSNGKNNSGNSASLKACYEFAGDFGREILYFVEDDYLHVPSAISEMLEDFERFTKNLNKQIGLFPVDYPDRYTAQGIYPSRIVLGEHRHWRTIQHSTFTFMISRVALLQNWDIFEKIGNVSSNFIDEDSTINKLWQTDVTLFSPIPSLAIHVQSEKELPPFFVWT